MRLWRRMVDRRPRGFTAELADDEHVVASAETDAGPLVATTLGLWMPDDGGFRCARWHLISKVSWADGVMSVVQADETARAGDAVLIADRKPVRFTLRRPGRLPKVVRDRVDGSIRSRSYKELPGGGAWFVERTVAGAPGVLQARADPGTDLAVVASIAEETAAKLADAS